MLNKYLLKEGILKDVLPYDIVSAIIKHATSLGNNPAIPDIYEVPFLAKICNQRFNELKEELKEIGVINVNSKNLYEALAEMINKCKEIEKPIRSQLEQECFSIVLELFQIPEESIDFEIKLVDKLNIFDYNLNIDPEDSLDIDLNSVKEGLSIKEEIFKRRILNVLITGLSMKISNNIENYFERINKINPELCELYRNIVTLNNYLLFDKENVGINDKTPKQMGITNVEIGSTEDRIKITAQGLIFPILLNETIKGLLELFISHGLPKNRTQANYILKKTDFLKAEPWNMRLGPSLWDLLSNSLNDISSEELPYLLKRISKLNVDKFNYLMKEVFAKTKKGKHIMSKISFESKNDIEYDKFVDKMGQIRKNKNVITDEYIHENEL
jgi:hypothetical protein